MADPKSWKKITNDIPKSYSSFVHVIKEDYYDSSVLFAGTDNGLYYSLNDGNNWNRLKNNLPPAPVYWISLQKRFDDMVVGTYGRGIYIMDDISPIRELARKDLSIDQLLPTQSAYRFQMLQAMKSDGSSLINGRNPKYGANIDFYLINDNKKSIFIEISLQYMDMFSIFF